MGSLPMPGLDLAGKRKENNRTEISPKGGICVSREREPAVMNHKTTKPRSGGTQSVQNVITPVANPGLVERASMGTRQVAHEAE